MSLILVFLLIAIFGGYYLYNHLYVDRVDENSLEFISSKYLTLSEVEVYPLTQKDGKIVPSSNKIQMKTTSYTGRILPNIMGPDDAIDGDPKTRFQLMDSKGGSAKYYFTKSPFFDINDKPLKEEPGVFKKKFFTNLKSATNIDINIGKVIVYNHPDKEKGERLIGVEMKLSSGINYVIKNLYKMYVFYIIPGKLGGFSLNLTESEKYD